MTVNQECETEPHEIEMALNLKTIIAESREVAKALNEFADELERIEIKYTEIPIRK